MILAKNKHIELITSELTYQTNEFDKLLRKSAARMFLEHELYLCRYVGFDEARSNLLVKFDHSICQPPRKNEILSCFISHVQDERVKNWGGMTYEELRSKVITQFECRTIFFKYDSHSTIVGISGVLAEDVEKYEIGALIFLAPSDPPLNYLMNLKNYLSDPTTANDKYLNVKINEPEFRPEPLVIDENILDRFKQDFKRHDTIIIQGPPGTGKTYLMALLCSLLLEEQKTILVTALTNKALIELAEKKFLRSALEKGFVFKTSLTAQESKSKKTRGIKALKSMSQQNPPLLLSTYYVMSQLAVKVLDRNHFDYVIIEEASQAFLSTLAMAKKLGRKAIIIGDTEQLQPIFHMEFKEDSLNGYHWMVSGLKTLSGFFKESKNYILTDSYRLTENSVHATNAFYNDLLQSKSDVEIPHDFTKYPILNKYFDPFGGVSLSKLEMSIGRLPSSDHAQLIVDLINAIHAWDKDAEIAVLSFYRATVRSLQSQVFSKIDSNDNLLVETVDRVQGLTTDFCIYYIPLESAAFALDINRFNVATSRSRKGTLIMIDNIISDELASENVQSFFKRVKIVS